MTLVIKLGLKPLVEVVERKPSQSNKPLMVVILLLVIQGPSGMVGMMPG